MKRKILIYALLSTPLLAVYGVAPFYIFEILSLNNSFYLLLGIYLSVIFFWIKNYLLIYVFKLKKILVYCLSYFLAFFSKFIFLLLGAPLFAFKEELSPYVVYPAIVTIALNTLVIYILFNLKKENEKKETDKKNSELLVQNLTAEKQSLKQQLQPHFLFNALSVLKSLINEDANAAEKYVVQLSEFLRYSVDEHYTEKVLIKDEMQFVNNYLALQKIRFENSFSFKSDVPKYILEKYIPVFAVQIGIENAFKHNTFTEENPLQLSIEFKDDCLIVCNNLANANSENRVGSGLINLKKRYQLLGEKNCITLQQNEQFCLQLPIFEK